jgi:predicted enzyme related to lactoylglutathione lyase
VPDFIVAGEPLEVAGNVGAPTQEDITMHRDDAINWFEIPVTDLPRTQRFYESALGTSLIHEAMGPLRLAILRYRSPGVGG